MFSFGTTVELGGAMRHNAGKLRLAPIQVAIFGCIEIKRWRKRLGITQARAAELLGVSLRAIKYYESGERQPRESVLRLAAMIRKEKKIGKS